MKKWLTIFLLIMLISSSTVTVANFSDNIEYRTLWKEDGIILEPYFQTTFDNDSEKIDEYTWSFMRYDHPVESDNFGLIGEPKPTQGVILILTNMMSMEVCQAAVNLHREDKMETLKALEDYDVKNMIHSTPAFFREKEEWNSPTIDSYRKVSAHEMGVLGQICLKGNLVGDCYSQASFNTAVLRLCGFSPEEVFNLHVPGHIVNIVKVDGQWYVFDSVYAQSVKRGYVDSLIFEEYYPPIYDYIIFLENDKYFINFGVLWPEYWPYLANNYSNLDTENLTDMMEQLPSIFNNSLLGLPEWEIHEFIENATPCPDMITLEVPYTVEDASGACELEKAQSLIDLNIEYILNQTGTEIINQYDRSLYSSGFLNVEYPQAYANAAKYAAWTSWIATRLDRRSPTLDCLITALWIRLNIFNRQMMECGSVAFSDFPYLRRAGSSIDQAVMAYGTLRNMKKDDDFWPIEDLYVTITEDNVGYLSVKISDTWKYLNFERGRFILSEIPDVNLAFNEKNRSDVLP